MLIHSQIHLLSIMFDAMMEAIGLPLPKWYHPLYLIDMQGQIRHGMAVDEVAAHLYQNSGARWDLQNCLKIARMTRTLWAMVKLTDLPERRYDA